MKRKIFDIKLYFDALKQMRLIGILTTVIFSITSVIIIASAHRSAINNAAYIQADGHISQSTFMSVKTLLDINPVIVASFIILAPLLTMYMFGFLNKRSTSDFWHSIPHKRICIYSSFFAAVFSWVFIAVIISSGISLAGFLAMPKYYAINWVSVISTLCSMLACSLLVEAVFVTAMSVTGTYFSNIIVALLLLFLPRILILYLNIPLLNNNFLFTQYGSSDILSNTINLVTSFFLMITAGLMIPNDIDELFCAWPSVIYTFAVAVIYFIIGALLFKKRKSESAASSAMNKYLQAAIRITISFAICLIPLYFVFYTLKVEKTSFHDDDLFFIVVMYFIAFAAYLIYELITTKKVKSMLNSIKSFPIVILLNFVIFASLSTIYGIAYNYQPVPNEVDSLKIFSERINESTDYFTQMSGKIEIKNEELEKFLCEKYQNTKKIYEEDKVGYVEYIPITVGFGNSGHYRYRNIALSEEEYQDVLTQMSKSEEMRKLYTDISPLFKAEHIEIRGEHFIRNNVEKIFSENKDKILAAYENDIKTIGFNEWYSLLSNSPRYIEQEKSWYSVAFIDGYISSGSKSYSFSLPISNLTKSSYEFIMSGIYDIASEENHQTEILEKLKNYKKSDENHKYTTVEIMLYNGTTCTYPEYYSDPTEQNCKMLYEILSGCIGVKPKSDSRICRLYYSGYKSVTPSGVVDEHYEESVYFTVPDDADLTFLLGEADTEKYSYSD